MVHHYQSSSLEWFLLGPPYCKSHPLGSKSNHHQPERSSIFVACVQAVYTGSLYKCWQAKSTTLRKRTRTELLEFGCTSFPRTVYLAKWGRVHNLWSFFYVPFVSRMTWTDLSKTVDLMRLAIEKDKEAASCCRWGSVKPLPRLRSKPLTSQFSAGYKCPYQDTSINWLPFWVIFGSWDLKLSRFSANTTVPTHPSGS